MASFSPTDAALSASAPAFVQAPTFVFAANAPAPTRSEVLRQQIEAARTARRASIW
ncbi:hypothetical protein [Sphingomonas phyllosphaerae]|uniref:hypothetical protein n=1 Tax=Sphingomonas phyllosphaerae TaxID=257003 RepID=UPI000410481B|nr:hypothetical protein [Sphingomonas phyllosphaerae]